jgi:hypothetical protein
MDEMRLLGSLASVTIVSLASAMPSNADAFHKTNK